MQDGFTGVCQSAVEQTLNDIGESCKMLEQIKTKINHEGAKTVMERYKRRKECKAFNLSDEKLADVIVFHAIQEEEGKLRKPNVCINCSYSAPWHGRFTWTGRSCSLGITNKNDCYMRVKIVEKAKEGTK